MAKIYAGLATSHVPAIGAAIDQGKTQEPYWQPVFAGYEFAKRWVAEHKPDVVILVYNDHASAFSVELIPTFALATSGTPHNGLARRGNSQNPASASGAASANSPRIATTFFQRMPAPTMPTSAFASRAQLM